MSLNRVVLKETRELFAASENGNLEKVKDLLENTKADIDWHRHESYGCTPLMVAIVKGHEDVALKLIKEGADVSVLKIPDFNTPLHEACLNGLPKVAQALLSLRNKVTTQGMDSHAWNMLSCQNQFGNTPLHSAAKSGCIKIVEMLIEAGANTEDENIDKSTPLHHACYCNESNEEVIAFLVKSGSKIDVVDSNGHTPLMIAARKNQAKAIDVLLKAGANQELKDKQGNDAFLYAKQRNHTEAIKLLS